MILRCGRSPASTFRAVRVARARAASSSGLPSSTPASTARRSSRPIRWPTPAKEAGLSFPPGLWACSATPASRPPRRLRAAGCSCAACRREPGRPKPATDRPGSAVRWRERPLPLAESQSWIVASIMSRRTWPVRSYRSGLCVLAAGVVPVTTVALGRVALLDRCPRVGMRCYRAAAGWAAFACKSGSRASPARAAREPPGPDGRAHPRAHHSRLGAGMSVRGRYSTLSPASLARSVRNSSARMYSRSTAGDASTFGW